MKISVGHTILELVEGDIADQDTEAIVNAANTSLLGGGGVDGAIHEAAGPRLLEECRTLGGCPTGEAKLTRGYRLKAKFVIHAVGPVYRPGDPEVRSLLAGAYRNSMEIAHENGIRSIAFPSISTGAYRFPLREAAPLALSAILEALGRLPGFSLIRFVLFDREAMKAYSRALEELTKSGPYATLSAPSENELHKKEDL